MNRHITPGFAMFTGEGDGNERRTTDLIVLDDGREGAVLRHFKRDDCTTWYVTEVPGTDTVSVAMCIGLYSDDVAFLDWQMPHQAAEHLILAFIEATD